jgi:hypothetical protein
LRSALWSRGEAFVPAEIALAEGQHQVAGWVDRGGQIEEFDRSNNVSRFDITVGPGNQPPPGAALIQATSPSHRVGDPILIEGEAPDGTYCAAGSPTAGGSSAIPHR